VQNLPGTGKVGTRLVNPRSDAAWIPYADATEYGTERERAADQTRGAERTNLQRITLAAGHLV
jgi:hypothetical protein